MSRLLYAPGWVCDEYHGGIGCHVTLSREVDGRLTVSIADTRDLEFARETTAESVPLDCANTVADAFNCLLKAARISAQGPASFWFSLSGGHLTTWRNAEVTPLAHNASHVAISNGSVQPWEA
jgi:hypothetical protein